MIMRVIELRLWNIKPMGLLGDILLRNCKRQLTH
jgi:hypothetical protein